MRKLTSSELLAVNLMRERDELKASLTSAYNLIAKQAREIEAGKPIGEFDPEGLSERVDAAIERRGLVVGETH